MAVVMLTKEDSGSALREIRAAVQSADPEQAVELVDSMESIVRDSLEPWRFALSLLVGLAGMAVVLTVLGLFAVMSYLVSERTREIGVRMALGADRDNVVWLVLTQTRRVALYGTVTGIFISMVVARLVGSTEYLIHPNDPAIFIGMALLLAVVLLIASLLPALKAAQLDPMTALREQ